jgi:hypothetical protein
MVQILNLADLEEVDLVPQVDLAVVFLVAEVVDVFHLEETDLTTEVQKVRIFLMHVL